MRNHRKPLLFVDIDGVLSLFGFQSDRCPHGVWLNVEGIVHLISATASEHLHRLAGPFELVWCSGWEEKANEHLLGALVLPDALPFLTFTTEEGATRHWKLAAIEAHAGDRALAWIDDAHDDSCRAWAAERPAPTLLVTTDPAAGLTIAHVEALERWAGGLTPAADSPRR
jgi:HAD domain in Swiss Army Knife RNA repair proteins